MAGLILLAGAAAVGAILYYGDYFGGEDYYEYEDEEYEEETTAPRPVRPAPEVGRPPQPPPEPKEEEPEPVFGRSLLGPRAPLDTRKRRDTGGR